MRQGTILPIALMAFAIVAFLFMVDLSISPMKPAPGKNMVLLAGHVWIYGCPAQMMNSPCGGPPPTSDSISVYTKNSSRLVAAQHYSQNGTFSFHLSAGDYVLYFGNHGLPKRNQNQQDITLVSDHDVPDLNIQIDNGIR